MRNNIHKTGNPIANIFITLLAFFAIVDPTTTLFFGISKIVFVVLFIVSLFVFTQFDKNGLIAVAIFLFILLLTDILGYLLGYTFDTDFLISVYKGYAYFVLLIWAKNYTLLDKLTMPSIIVSITIISITLIIMYNPYSEPILREFFYKHSYMIRIGERRYLGYRFYGIAYVSAYCLLLPFAIYIYKFLFEKQKKNQRLIICVLLGVALFLTGTRANMGAMLCLVGIMVVLRMNRTSIGQLVALLSTVIIFIAGTFVLFLLLAETGEGSIKVKYDHLDSYLRLFMEYPQILIFGQGLGAMFYSSGFGIMTPITEWTFMEIFRTFGIPLGLCVIGIFVYPLFVIYQKRRQLNLWKPVFFGYFFFLIVGGTNPHLFYPPGILVLLTMYSFISNPIYRNNNEQNFNNSSLL